jgi:hypothetical protein
MAATLDDVARYALALPDVTEGERRGHRTWSVGGKGFAWERPYRKRTSSGSVTRRLRASPSSPFAPMA